MADSKHSRSDSHLVRVTENERHDRFTTLGNPDNKNDWVFIEFLQNALSLISIIGITIVPEIGALFYGPKLFTVGIQPVQRRAGAITTEAGSVNNLAKRNWRTRNAVFDSYRASTLDALRHLYPRLDEYRGRSRANVLRRENIISQIGELEANIEHLYDAEFRAGADIPLVVPQYKELIIPRPTIKYRVFDALSKLCGLLPGIAGAVSTALGKAAV